MSSNYPYMYKLFTIACFCDLFLFVCPVSSKPQICAHPQVWTVDENKFTQADSLEKSALVSPIQQSTGSVRLVAMVNSS